MGKIKKFTSFGVRKITGGRDPLAIIEEFLARLGFDAEECQKEKTSESVRWMVTLHEGEELEILAEALKVPHETTIYMGVNIATIPIRGASDMLAAALEIADGLVGIKVSLVGHYLVLSSTMSASSVDVDEVEYQFKLITAQQSWFKQTLAEELGLDEMPEA